MNRADWWSKAQVLHGERRSKTYQKLWDIPGNGLPSPGLAHPSIQVCFPLPNCKRPAFVQNLLEAQSQSFPWTPTASSSLEGSPSPWPLPAQPRRRPFQHSGAQERQFLASHHFPFSEPIGGSKPKFSLGGTEAFVLTRTKSKPIALLCPAQGAPLPSYRSVRGQNIEH